MHEPCSRGVDELRLAVRGFVRDGVVPATDAAWRAAARSMSNDARARDVQIEELIIALKRTWPGLAEAERVPREQSPGLLARVVTLCVEEFYTPRD